MLRIAPANSKISLSTFKLAICLLLANFCLADIPSSKRATKAVEDNTPPLEIALDDKGLSLGSPIFIRIFKQQSRLELWIENNNGKFSLFKHYPICYYSGSLGPKQRQGDKQSPEGFYFVTPERLNPWSSFHLSFNLGYPNAYDRYHKRTGSHLMVHGDCVSIGCYAMTDEKIEEIYTLAYHAFKNGQKFFRVHIFPFKLTEENLNNYKSHEWYAFWQNLKEGYDLFEKHHRPPNTTTAKGRYLFTP